MSTFLNGQVKNSKTNVDTNTTKVGFGITTTAHFMIYNKKLNQLNQILESRNLPSLYPSANSYAVSIHVKNENLISFFEMATMNWILTKKDLTNQDWLVPKIKGISFNVGVLSKIWSKGRKSVHSGFAFSSNIYEFRLIDRRQITASFDSLLLRPTSASASFDASPKGVVSNIEGRIGYTYNTEWFKKTIHRYEFSVFLAYNQMLFGSKNWVVKDTNIKIPNFPNINFSNVNIQFSNIVYFKRN